MNKFILLSFCLALFLGVVESFDYQEKELQSEQGLQALYERWRSHHKVAKKGPERFNVFKSNVELVHATNKMNKPYKLELNSMADLTAHEVTSQFGNSKLSHYRQLMGIRKNLTSNFMYKDATDLPPRIDWRELNAVGPVKNQGACGSCYTFSAVCAVEGINAIRTGKLVALSEQMLMDCDSSGNAACDGGLMEPAFKYIQEHGGLVTEEFYPYTAVQGPCHKEKFAHHAVTLDGGEEVPQDEDSLMKAVAHQPVAFAMDVSGQEFSLYKEGVFTGPCGNQPGHAMAIVGYDETPEGLKYWIVRNSWSENWGEGGYMKVQRGVNLGALNSDCSYPLKNPSTCNIEL